MLDYQIKLLEAKIRGVRVDQLFDTKEGLDTEKTKILNEQIQKLKSGYPLDYLLGEVEILDLKLIVNEEVLIPRPETEEWLFAFDKIINQTKQNLLVDLGCGSGIIGLYLSKFYNKAYCVDVSPKAIEVTKDNAVLNNIKNIEFYLSDGLSDKLLQKNIQKFKSWTLIANLPYLPQSDKTNSRVFKVEHEPDLALYSGQVGLDLFRKVLVELETFDIMPIEVIFELDPRNIRIAETLLKNLNYKVNIWEDSGGFKRVLIGILLQ